jgi:hypothetical protein
MRYIWCLMRDWKEVEGASKRNDVVVVDQASESDQSSSHRDHEIHKVVAVQLRLPAETTTADQSASFTQIKIHCRIDLEG